MHQRSAFTMIRLCKNAVDRKLKTWVNNKALSLKKLNYLRGGLLYLSYLNAPKVILSRFVKRLPLVIYSHFSGKEPCLLTKNIRTEQVKTE